MSSLEKEDDLDRALSGQTKADRLIDSAAALIAGLAFEIRLSHTIGGIWRANELEAKAEHDAMPELVGELGRLKRSIPETPNNSDQIADDSKMVADYLRSYNAWRRGEDERTMDEAGIVPAELGQMIDAAVAALEERAARAQGDAEPVTAWRDLEIGESKMIGDRFLTFSGRWVEMTEDHFGFEDVVTAATRPMQRKVYGTHPPKAQVVPEWMTEVSENLATQNNRITQDPLFVVFQKREIVVDEDYDHDRISWGNCEGEADDEVQDWLNDAREDVDGDHYLDDEIEFHDEDSGTETFRRVALKETDKFVTACITEAGAKDYLNANGHNLTRPHIYVTSLYRNEEMKRLRDWLMSQPPQEGA